MSTRIRTLSRAAIMVALLIAVLALPAFAAAAGPCTTVCYVDATTGNNANDGDTPATAKKTIQAAVTQVTAGGQVNVAAGTYAEDVTINKAVTVTGAGPATTIIDPVNYVSISADNVTIEDIAISAGTHGARLSKSGSPLANTTFDNVHFKNNTSRGIDIVNLLHVTNLQVLNSLFEGNPTGIRMPSNATADGITIDNTTFQNQTGSGFYQANDAVTGWVKNLTVTNSTFINLGTSGSGHAGVYAEEFSNVLIEDSTFTGNRYGINLFDAYSVASSVTTNVVIRGNTFTDHKASAISFRSTTSDPNAQLLLVEDNTFTQNVSNYAAGSFAAVAVSTHATNGNGAVDVVNNTITLSGALPVGATTAHGIYVAGGMDDVRVEGNNVDGGGIANNGGTIPPTGVYIQSFSMKANAVVLVTKNGLINFNNGVSVHNGSAFGGVKSPDFDVTRNDLSGNSGFGIQSGPTMASDGTCNWWGDASGPSGEGIGSGTAVSTHVDFSTWLGSSDLNGVCQAGATITVSKVTDPNTDTTTVFTFDPSWSATNFTLKNGENVVSGLLPAGNYSVTEVSMPALWALQSATCDNTATGPVETADPSSLTVAAGDTWSCTFTNRQLELCSTVCYADIVNGSDTLNAGTGPSDAFKTIQKAIDTVTPGGEVRVLPGTYDQDEKNGVDPVTGGAGGNNFNIFVHKADLTIQGVTAGDVDITTAAGAQAIIKPKRNQPTFGSSAMFVQADGVTIRGVKFVADNGAAYADKVVEIIGNDVTVDAVAFDVTGGAVGIYISDFSYDATNDLSTVQDFTFTNGLFTSANQTGLAVQVASGAGWPDNVGTRTISGNTFSNLDDALTFAGAGSAGWRLYPVGTADITGNTFSQIKRRHLLVYGNYPVANPTALGYTDPDWCGILANNTFDKATFLWEGTTRCPSGEPRRWEAASGEPAPYDAFRNVAGIYSAIQQYGVGRAVSGDLLEVFPGTYVEQVTVNKTMTLLGHGPATTFIKAPATLPNAGTQDSIIVKITGAGVQVEMSEFTVTGPGPSSCGSIGYGIFVRDGAYANIHDNKVVDIKDTGLSGCQNGNAIGVGRQLWSTSGTADITDNEISTYQKTGIIVDNAGSSATIEGNTVSGDGPISYIAENGIQVSRGATAEINDNTVTGHSYTGTAGAASAGMLLWGAGTTNTDGNTVTGNQVGIWVIDTSGTHQNNTIAATATSTGLSAFWGMIVDAPPPNRPPSPADAEAADVAAPATVGPNPPAVVQTVVVTGNTFTSNNSAGGVGLEIDGGYGSYDIDTTATKNFVQNWDYGVVVFECTSGGCTGTTFANVDINRNSITGNTNGMFADTVDPNETDGTCNWWGDASGPSGEGLGTGDTVSTEVDFTPWLYSSDLDGPCYVGGTISIDKVATGGGATQFTFDVSWSATNVTLTDASAPYVTNPPLQAGNYTITEINPPLGWSLQSATCDNATTTPVETVDPANITVADGDEWLCTFTNVYTPPPANTCAVPGTQYTDLLGMGMGTPKKHKTAAVIKLPNYTNLVALYGQMVAKVPGDAKYVRFVMPGKNNYVQVSTITAPSDHAFGNFWYGADIPWATTPPKQVKGQWFLQKTGTKNHIPRAFVLYATYQHPTNRYVNVWDTFTPAEGEVYWDIAQGWTPTRQIVVPIPAPLGPTTFNVELALVDNDKDTRPVWVTVTAGNVTQTQMPTNPSNGEQLNLMTFTLANVPAGTSQIVIKVYSPSPSIDGVNGDSATLVGMAANYLCTPISTP